MTSQPIYDHPAPDCSVEDITPNPAHEQLGALPQQPVRPQITASNMTFNDPATLMDQLKTSSAPYALFLDIDGTLADFCNDPKHSVIPQQTLTILAAIQQCRVPVIAVTGRQIEVAQQLFAPLCLPIAGLHGLDIMLEPGISLSPDLSAIDFAALRQSLEQACTEYPRLRLEDKQHSFALHYRTCPELEPVAHDIMQQLQRRHLQLKLNHGKCVVEILPVQADKGQAIQTILTHLGLDGITPLFIGDDITDESGFKVVNAHQGISIKVGTGATDATYRLKNTAAVAEFLNQFHQFLQCGARTHDSATRHVQQQDGEQTCQN